MKKIYFTCTVSGGRDYAFVYQDIVDVIKKSGAEVKGDLFADPNLDSETGTDPQMSPQDIWERDTRWLKEADAVIAEASQPSLGVGYEIALAESSRIPVLVLFYKNSLRRFSPMIRGNPLVQTFEYTKHSEAKKAIKAFIAQLG